MRELLQKQPHTVNSQKIIDNFTNVKALLCLDELAETEI